MSEAAPAADRGKRSGTRVRRVPLIIGVLAAGCLFSVASSVLALDCVSSFGAITLDGDLDVAVPCELNGTIVNGKVRVFAGGSLRADRAQIHGNLEAKNADFVVLIESLVTGNLKLEQLVGDLSGIDLSEVDGKVQLNRNRSRLELQDSRVNDDVRVEENTGGVLILRNRIDGNLSCRRNDPPPDGGGNHVSRRSSDQCANLQLEGSAAPSQPPPGGEEPVSPPPSAGSPSPPGGSSGGSSSGGSGTGGSEINLNPQPSGGGAALGPLEIVPMLLLGLLLAFRTRATR